MYMYMYFAFTSLKGKEFFAHSKKKKSLLEITCLIVSNECYHQAYMNTYIPEQKFFVCAW